MRTFALIGKQIDYSFSQQYFSRFFCEQGLGDCRYLLWAMPSLESLESVAAQWEGFNVTIPYKEAILPRLHSLTDVARTVGAVNCVKVIHQGGLKLIGHNADAPAFQSTLQPLLKPHYSAALVLGTGGASKAVVYVLQQLGIDYLLVSRRPHGPRQVGYDRVNEYLERCQIVVNATPVGTCGTRFEGLSPLAADAPLSSEHLCYDLVYNPSPSPFLQQAARAGAAVKDGLEMLYRQADLSWQFWNR